MTSCIQSNLVVIAVISLLPMSTSTQGGSFQALANSPFAQPTPFLF